VTDWRSRAEVLARQLGAVPGVDPRWAAVFAEVPRHVFVPRYYRDQQSSQPRRLIDGADPAEHDEWLDGVYRDDSLATQLAPAPGTADLWVPTSSSTRPSLMARMLTLLEVGSDDGRDNDGTGPRVLEIGTGTGYNAALLSHRLGAERVASVDIDPDLVVLARERLAGLGLHPHLAAGDGADGWAKHAPYDRIIGTCAVAAIPAAWVAQLRPGGIVVADVRGALESSLLVAHAQPDGTAIGRFLAEPGHFMWMRTRADNPLRHGGQYRTHYDHDEASPDSTSLNPHVLAEPGFRFLLQLMLPDIGFIPRDAGRSGRPIRIAEEAGESWAEVDPLTGAVLQAGPVDLVGHLERTAELWSRFAEPTVDRLGITTSPTGTTIWLDSPTHPLVKEPSTS
jgi:protein-L-isoaspartate(D-aspartate) O-methyltransferase